MISEQGVTRTPARLLSSPSSLLLTISPVDPHSVAADDACYPHNSMAVSKQTAGPQKNGITVLMLKDRGQTRADSYNSRFVVASSQQKHHSTSMALLKKLRRTSWAISCGLPLPVHSLAMAGFLMTSYALYTGSLLGKDCNIDTSKHSGTVRCSSLAILW